MRARFALSLPILLASACHDSSAAAAPEVYCVVLGAVDHPGPLKLAAGATVLEAVRQAGLQPGEADLAHVVLRHADAEEQLTLDLAKLLQGGDSSRNVALRDGDVLVVPAAAAAPR